MFRLFRLAILLVVAFVAGMLFERSHQHDLCDRAGGEWVRGGYCTEA